MTSETRVCLAEMGITGVILDRVRTAPNQKTGELLLNEAKAICKKGFREIAHRYHPDLHHGSTAEIISANENKFKRLKSVYESFQSSSFNGWRRVPRKGKSRPVNVYDYAYQGDQLMANFMRMKMEAQVAQAKRREDNLRSAFVEDLLRQNRVPRTRERTRPFTGKRKGKTRPYNPSVALANKGGIWYPKKGRWLLRTERIKRE